MGKQKTKEIKIRVTEEEYHEVKRTARKKRETVSEYVRSHLDKDLTKKWVRKTEIQQFLSRIEVKLDKWEERNAGFVQSIREVVKELWEII